MNRKAGVRKNRTLGRILAVIVLATILATIGRLTVGENAEVIAHTAVREQILASTLQIELHETNLDGEGQEKVYAAQGLGTLVEINGQHYVITHNHWPQSVVAIDCLVLRNAQGALLLTLDRATLLSLVCYQDEGTLLLAAPPQLVGVKPAQLDAGGDLTPGDELWLAVRQTNQGVVLGVTRAVVVPSGDIDMAGTLRLQGPATAVSPGDSGGGVWRDGKLTGNLWAIIETLNGTPRVLRGLWGDANETIPSGFYLAAEVPRFNLPVTGQGVSFSARGEEHKHGLLP